MSSDEVQNPVHTETFQRATKGKRLTDLELGKVSSKYDKYDHHTDEVKVEGDAEFDSRKETFGIDTTESLIKNLSKRFLSEYPSGFLGIASIVGTIVVLLNVQHEKDALGLAMERCGRSEDGTYEVPVVDSDASVILQWFFIALVIAVLFKVFSDCGKQIVYYELFTYGALVDFENSKPPYYSCSMGFFCMMAVYWLFIVDEDVAPSALKQSLIISLLSQAWSLRGKHQELRNRESNILCVNQVFEHHHDLARHHLMNITVLPYRVVKLVLAKLYNEKTKGAELLTTTSSSVKQEGKNTSAKDILDAVPEDKKSMVENFEVVDNVLKFRKISTRELYVRCMMVMDSRSVSIESTRGDRVSSSSNRPSIEKSETMSYESKESKAKLKELKGEGDIGRVLRNTIMMPFKLGEVYAPVAPHVKAARNVFSMCYIVTLALVVYGLFILPTSDGDNLNCPDDGLDDCDWTVCSGTWIGDGECDSSCNNSDCNYDGGDCSELLSELLRGCEADCELHWLGDGQCDTQCNTAGCLYDNGDCS